MDANNTTPPPEKTADSPSPSVQHDVRADTPPTEPEFIPPAINKPSKFRYLWLVLIIGLVLSVVGVGAFIIDSENKRQPTQLSTLLTPTPDMPDPTPTPDPTADWQTYTSDALDFSVKLPKDWIIQDPTRTDPTIYFKSEEVEGFYVWVDEYNNLERLPFEEVATAGFDKTIKDSFTFTKEPLGSYSVYKTESIPSRSGALSVFITADESKYISLSFTPYDPKEPFDEQEVYLGIFNQMLSTFKLSASPSATATPSGSAR